MTEICNDVRIIPDLQPLTGEHFDNATAIVNFHFLLLNCIISVFPSTLLLKKNATAITQNGARVDILANGFWGVTL